MKCVTQDMWGWWGTDVYTFTTIIPFSKQIDKYNYINHETHKLNNTYNEQGFVETLPGFLIIGHCTFMALHTILHSDNSLTTVTMNKTIADISTTTKKHINNIYWQDKHPVQPTFLLMSVLPQISNNNIKNKIQIFAS